VSSLRHWRLLLLLLLLMLLLLLLLLLPHVRHSKAVPRPSLEKLWWGKVT